MGMNLFEYLHARSNNENIDLLIARTQRSHSNGTLLLIYGVIAGLFLLPAIDSAVEKLLIFVLGGLVNNWASQNNFWFGRPRGAGVPDPVSTTITTTTPPPPAVPMTTITTTPVVPAKEIK